MPPWRRFCRGRLVTFKTWCAVVVTVLSRLLQSAYISGRSRLLPSARGMLAGAIASLFLSVVVTTSSMASVLDNFNRPDSATLGPNWTLQAGTAGITNNQAFGSFGQIETASLATFNGDTSNSVSFDIFHNGTGLQYVAAVIGFGVGTNYFVKIQDSGSGAFDTYGFYTGNNLFLFFQSLNSNFQNAHVTVTLVGSIATLVIAPNVGATQVYSFDYGFAYGGGLDGLGFFGSAMADNFGDDPATPLPGALALFASGLGTLGLLGWPRKRPNRARVVLK